MRRSSSVVTASTASVSRTPQRAASRRIVLARAVVEGVLEKGLSQHAGQRVGAMDREEARARARLEGDPERLGRRAVVEQPLGLEPLLQDVGHEVQGRRSRRP